MSEARIAPGLAPGGVVFQLWAGGRVLVEDRIKGEELGTGKPELGGSHAGALAQVAIAEGYATELRLYDGDTGEYLGTVATT